MENEQKKSDNHNRIYIIIAALVLCAGAYCTLRGSGNDAGTAELYQRTDSAVGAVEKQHKAIGRELDAASGQLDSAGTAISRADELIGRSQECVIRNTESVIECQQIVSECRKIIADSNRIIGEVDAANRSRTGSGGGS